MSGFLCCGSRGICPLKMSWETRGCSQLVAGNSGFLSSCDRYLVDPLELHKGNQAYFEFQEGTRDCSRGTAGKEGLISC